MPAVLVTGGTGSLGSYLVPRLVQRGHDVRVLSRRPTAKVDAPGVEVTRGDVRSGDGVAAAVRDIDVVVHAATLPLKPGSRRTEVEGTRRVLEASRDAGAHFIYVSIVGVDRHRFPYYRAKWLAEQTVEEAPGGWAIQRATQFHDLLAKGLKARVLSATKNMRFQPVDAGDVSDRLIELVESKQEGRVPDFGGPEVLSARDIVATWREETGMQAIVLPAPRVHFLADFDAGLHTCPDQAAGRLTWREWLRRRQQPAFG